MFHRPPRCVAMFRSFPLSLPKFNLVEYLPIRGVSQHPKHRSRRLVPFHDPTTSCPCPSFYLLIQSTRMTVEDLLQVKSSLSTVKAAMHPFLSLPTTNYSTLLVLYAKVPRYRKSNHGRPNREQGNGQVANILTLRYVSSFHSD